MFTNVRKLRVLRPRLPAIINYLRHGKSRNTKTPGNLGYRREDLLGVAKDESPFTDQSGV